MMNAAIDAVKPSPNGDGHRPAALPKIDDHDLDTERAAIGAVLTGYPYSSFYLERDDLFHDRRYASIWQVIRALTARNGTITLPTVTNELRLAGTLDAAGGLCTSHSAAITGGEQCSRLTTT